MQVWHGLGDVPPGAGPCVVAIGKFDGVHRGHARVLAKGRGYADELGLPMYVVTFDPHPQAVLRPDIAPKMIGSLADRLVRLAANGTDAVLVIPFTLEMAAVTAEQATRAVLADALAAKVVVVGADFRFGSGAAGDVVMLRLMGAAYGYTVHAVELQADETDKFSSTRVRELLALGDVAGAADILGRPYAVTGPVIRGEQRGRDLGFPTANLEIPDELVAPLDGVYAGWLVDGDERHPAAISVGDNPTFVGRHPPRRGLRARPHRPGPVRQEGRDRVRRVDPGHAALRGHRAPDRGHERRRRGRPGASWACNSTDFGPGLPRW